INEYLNLLTYSPYAIIVSQAFRVENNVELGQSINYSWDNQSSIEGVVVAFVNLWPSINPYEAEESQYFIIANLNYVQAKTMLQPYAIWLKTTENASTADIYNYINENNITLEEIKVAKQELIKKKNDPLLQGTNGAMTLGFIVTMTISIIGFIIYWILSIKSRVLQFGIFRAMGMTKANVVYMLAAEQVMISIVAIAVGIYIGGLSSNLFMPLLQMVATLSDQVPPFRIVSSRQDYLKLYTVVGVMLVSGFALVSIIASKIKIDQVLKLGED
ncbi:MAG: FtsX-like permease family protein, partial [Clostridiales bacterium]|nr:FtsX-like permease family protein [Clostridiales bacterium]